MSESLSPAPPSPTPREESPPSKASPPPTTLPLSRLPPAAQRALTSTPSPISNVLMPVDPSFENMQAPAQGEKGKERDGTGTSGKIGVEGVDFAYEYVLVSQVS